MYPRVLAGVGMDGYSEGTGMAGGVLVLVVLAVLGSPWVTLVDSGGHLASPARK